MNINISSSECAFANFEIKILTRTIKGLRGFSFKKEVEKEHLYGAGDEAIDIQSGNKKNSGSIKVLGFEADAMNKAARIAGFEDITEVPHELIVITCTYRKRLVDPISTYIASGVAFTESGVDLEQNAKFREITLPYLAMNVRLP
ncbi:hypothetical protein QWY99_22150 [Flavobacterium branchiarum]|uniref:Uncharacterized protein n=1 Tax=Flavobacterium branchiarum TaxID=1114870 RepID=A0ABV5FSL3_9FLAO|nr:hypothetical protein [Flavobacterium branchiarum]MDN3671507.1 hypothetical protein [Flavobacterium branchiarum]MDN3672616.1 hypothetical protein [Flavobacterium branchiarum]MDN3675740.1 hypothetical protein [Flavobacterium branchiarum]